MTTSDGNRPEAAEGAAAAKEPPNFIHVYPDVLSRAQCRELIDRFERDPRVRPSWGAYSAKPENRSGAMLAIGSLPEWRDAVTLVNEAIGRRVDHYAGVYLALRRVLMIGKCQLTQPLLERIGPGQGFDWHFDGCLPGIERRVLAAILYLADVPAGGRTEFAYQGAVVQPMAGALVLFPPFWTHLHRGATPEAGLKYNITNFLTLAD